MASGSLALRLASSLTDADGALWPAGSPLRESEPQPVRASAATQAVARLRVARRFTVLLRPRRRLCRGVSRSRAVALGIIRGTPTRADATEVGVGSPALILARAPCDVPPTS